MNDIILLVLGFVFSIVTLIITKEYKTIKENKQKIYLIFLYLIFWIIPIVALAYIWIFPKGNIDIFVLYQIFKVSGLTLYLSFGFSLFGYFKNRKMILIMNTEIEDLKTESVLYKEKNKNLDTSIYNLQTQINNKGEELSSNIGEVRQLKETNETYEKRIEYLEDIIKKLLDEPHIRNHTKLNPTESSFSNLTKK